MTITIKKTHVYWLAIFALQVLFIAWYQGFLTPDTVKPAPPSFALVMTEEEARLTRQAIVLVREDVVEGKLTSTALTLQALSSMLPFSVRDTVLKELGAPDMDFIVDALDILEGKLP